MNDTALTLQSLGLTQEDLAERLIETLADRLLTEIGYDENGNEEETASSLHSRLRKRIRDRVDERIEAIAQEHVIPRVDELIQNIVIQETTRWGEKKGKPATLIEYIVERADAYMREPVGHDGKTKDQSSYQWREAGDRLGWLIDQKLQYAITAPVKQIAQNAQQHIAAAISKTVQAQLEKLAKGLKVDIAVKG